MIIAFVMVALEKMIESSAKRRCFTDGPLVQIEIPLMLRVMKQVRKAFDTRDKGRVIADRLV